MGKMGKLTPDQFGATMPVTAPATQSPPFYYRNMELMIITYKTDPEAALDLLPDGLELVEPATATMIIGHYHFSTFGPYHEAIMGINCTFEGQPMTYLPYLLVTHEAPLIAGREIYGYPKKLGHVELSQQSEQYMGIVERPTGNRIATAVMRTVDNVPAADFPTQPIVNLKVIPDAEDKGDNSGPALAQLVSSEFDLQPIVGTDGVTELWKGPGSLVFNSPSFNDPWHKLGVEEVVSCHYGFFNLQLPYGEIIKEYV
jgi:acetoacetate decarboxylase